MHNIGATHISSKHGVRSRDQTTHNQRVSGTILVLKSRILKLDRTCLCAARGLFNLGAICHWPRFIPTINNPHPMTKTRKTIKSVSSRLTINVRTTKSQSPSIIPSHFNPNAPNTTAGGPSAAAASFRSHGIAAALALQPILLNEAAVPGARLTPHKQRMDRAIERLGRHRLNCSFHQESLAHAQLPSFEIAHQEPSSLVYTHTRYACMNIFSNSSIAMLHWGVPHCCAMIRNAGSNWAYHILADKSMYNQSCWYFIRTRILLYR